MVSDHDLRAALSDRVEGLDLRTEAELEGVLRRAHRRAWARRSAYAVSAVAASVATVLVTTYGLRSTEGAPDPVDEPPPVASRLEPQRGKFLDPAPLDAGLHRVAFQGAWQHYLEVDVPTGWSQDDDMVLTTGVGDRPGTLRIELSGAVQQVFSDPCRAARSPMDGGAAEIATALAGMRRLSTGPAVATTLDGHDGYLVRLEVPGSLDPTTCKHGWLKLYRNAGWDKGYPKSGWTDLIWVMDVGGKTLMIDACYGPLASPEEIDELVHMVETASFVTP
jgi:hypothetical protein